MARPAEQRRQLSGWRRRLCRFAYLSGASMMVFASVWSCAMYAPIIPFTPYCFVPGGARKPVFGPMAKAYVRGLSTGFEVYGVRHAQLGNHVFLTWYDTAVDPGQWVLNVHLKALDNVSGYLGTYDNCQLTLEYAIENGSQ